MSTAISNYIGTWTMFDMNLQSLSPPKLTWGTRFYETGRDFPIFREEPYVNV